MSDQPRPTRRGFLGAVAAIAAAPAAALEILKAPEPEIEPFIALEAIPGDQLLHAIESEIELTDVVELSGPKYQAHFVDDSTDLMRLPEARIEMVLMGRNDALVAAFEKGGCHRFKMPFRDKDTTLTFEAYISEISVSAGAECPVMTEASFDLIGLASWTGGPINA